MTVKGPLSLQRGYFRNLRAHGEIVIYYRNQSKYVGTCNNGEKHGLGTLTEPKEQKVYFGNFVRDMR